jgi:hypothetical protein
MSGERLHRAFDRIEDFLAVSRGLEFERYLEAVLCLQEAVGIEEAERAVIRDRLEILCEAYGQCMDQTGGLMLGLIVSGLAAEGIP